MLSLFEHIFRFIKANDLLENGDRVLVAFSAGPDSTLAVRALTEIAKVHRTRWYIELAHFNHGIDAGDMQAQVIAYESAERWGLKLHTKKAPANAFAGLRPGVSVQALARSHRYRFLLELARKHSFRKVVTAHQLDDQAETVLLRAISGSWLTGLAGIPISRALAKGAEDVQVVRPLLETSRHDILAALTDLKEKFHYDSSNDRTVYTRNSVRHNLMPLITGKFNAGAPGHLAALARQAGELDAMLVARARRMLERAERVASGKAIRVALGTLGFEPRIQQRYVIREALLELGVKPREVTFRRVEAALSLAQAEREGLSAQLTGEVTARIDGKHLLLERGARKTPGRFAPVQMLATREGGWTCEPSASLYSAISARLMPAWPDAPAQAKKQATPFAQYLEAAAVEFPLIVRPRGRGDRFVPLGMREAKRLQEFLLDRKIPRAARDITPLVCDQKGILWVVGHGIAERARVTAKTRQILALTATSPEGELTQKFEVEADGEP